MKHAFLTSFLVLSAGCVAPTTPNQGQENPLVSTARTILEIVGNDVMEVEGTAALREKFPEAIAFLDMPRTAPDGTVTPPDGKVSLDEVRSLFQTPTQEHIQWLAFVALRLARSHR